MPITALFGLAATMIIWIIILITQPYSRWVGIAWMVAGLIVYYFYRRRQRMSITTRIAKEQKENQLNNSFK